MNSYYGSDNDLQDMHPSGSDDREISLGTSTILGIFFALALVCAVFFGFGYTMGRRSAQPALSTTDPVTSNSASSSSTSKPAPGSPAPTAPANSIDQATDSATPDDPPASTTNPAATTATSLPEKSTAQPIVVSRAASPPVVSAPPAAGALSVVQVAAVSHKEDADVLLSALKKRGYEVAVREEPQDKLLHVQLGPFTTKKDADAMRLRLLADGYNAIVK